MKTLKEIDEEFLQKKGYSIICPAAIKLIKEEASKDITEFWRGHLPKELWGLTKEHKEGIEAYIKWKFNITEEELKKDKKKTNDLEEWIKKNKLNNTDQKKLETKDGNNK